MDWCLSLPKIELHAHLNGSIRDSTLLELAKVLGEKGIIVFADVDPVIIKKVRSLSECFKLFDLIHTITTDHETVTRIAKEAVEDFAAENVVYLELRTTPKKNEAAGMSKRSYVKAVVDGLRAVDAVDVSLIPYENSEHSLEPPPINGMCKGKERRKIHVRLLLSIDRRETTSSAMETVQLALEMRDLGVVGIDLSGNPVVGQWYFEFWRNQSLSAVMNYEGPDASICDDVHNSIIKTVGLVPNQKEIQAMLEFRPHRIGHACYFGEEEWLQLKAFNIPVEICLTSNIMTQSVSAIDVHHFVNLYKAKHPLILCTDDSGVFSTSLTHEYALAASTFGLGKGEMFHLVRNAIDFIFADDGVKKTLKEIFDSASRNFAPPDFIHGAAQGNSFVGDD